MIKIQIDNVSDEITSEAVESRSALPRVISYIPYGEIFVEQQSGGWQSPYLFNSKELDSETGLYYYGARYLDPTSAAWLSVDPLFEKYVGMSPYGYCAGNPVRLVDVDGMEGQSYKAKYDSRNDKEKEFIKSHPLASKSIADNATEAYQTTKKIFGYNGKGDLSDAFRHTYWNARNAQEEGEILARQFTDAHEYDTPDNELSWDLIMDIHNNEVGVEIGKNNPDADQTQLINLIIEKINKGEMLIIRYKTNERNEIVTDEKGHPIPLEIQKSNGKPLENGDIIKRGDVANRIKSEIQYSRQNDDEK